MSWLTEPLSYTFMQQALIIGILISVPAAVMSSVLVLKGWSLMGDAVSHAVLPGIVLAYLIGIPLVFGAFAAGMICAVTTGYLADNSRLKEDTVMGVVFSGMFALGILLFNQTHTNLHLDHVLFGNILGLNWRDVIETGLVTGIVLLVYLARLKDIKLFAFDAEHANIIGINTRFLHYLMLTLLSLVIVAALKAVGIILVIAVLIAPGATAFLLSRRFESMLLISVIVAVFSTTIGVLASYHINSAPAPTIVVLMTIIFFLAFLFAPQKGILRQKQRRAQASQVN